jgi:hypothetical protein
MAKKFLFETPRYSLVNNESIVGVTNEFPPNGIVDHKGAPVLLNPFKELPLVIKTDESEETEGVVKILELTTNG